MTTETGDPFGYAEKYDRSIEILESSGYSADNLEILMQFESDMYQSKLSMARAENIIYKFVQLGRQGHIDFNFREATESDLKKLVGKINRNKIKDKDLASETLRDYKKAISKLYDYLDQKEKVEFMSVSAKKSDRKYVDPSDLPTQETVETLCKGCRNPRDKAFLHLLYETGMRPIEIFNVKWKHISHTGRLSSVQIHRSKTFQRTIPFKNSKKYLDAWKKEHPTGSPESFVFTPLTQDKMAGYHTLYRSIQRASKRVETSSRINFKAFRKARATFLATNGFNVFQLMQFFGWSLPRTALYYVRLAENDLFDAYEQNLLQGPQNRSERQTAGLRIQQVSAN